MADEKVKLNRVYKDIDMAFGLNPVSSDIGKKIDVNAVKQSIKNLLLTKPFERKFNPNLASPLNRFLFEQATPTTRPMMIRAIEETIGNFEPRCEIDDIIIRDDVDNHLYQISIFYHVIGVNQPDVLSLSLTRVR